MSSYLEIASLLVSIIGSLFVWVMSDAKSRARAAFTEEKLQATNEALDAMSDRVTNLLDRLARSEQDRQDIHRTIDRLEEAKASRETVVGLTEQLNNIREDMDRRFDRLERLLQSALRSRGNSGEFDIPRE